ncbi:concanavalin A-like lectin/glucanase domain-containing protein [Aspergillus egyptiacus]|nr:concanavalin A-like lectin/glucanase domain-containing protein [Aspergillus egyptiacus]
MKLLTLTLASLASAASLASSTLTRRADFCGQWDTVIQGDFILYNNLWGQDNADSGSQCTGLDWASGNTIAWHTSWSWGGGQYNVKSFANAAYQFTATQLSSLSSIPTTWQWEYTSGNNMVANVAYDLFTTSSPGGSSEYEIMIWLAALGGAGPISSTGSPIASVTLGGVSWNLWYGLNGDMRVYSFVASSTTRDFSTDLVDFINYLEDSQGLSSTQYLTHVQAGTEPFVGSDATFVTASYSVEVL